MESTEPIDATDPAEPMERIDPALPIERIEPTLPRDRIDPALPIEQIEPTDPGPAPVVIGCTVGRRLPSRPMPAAATAPKLRSVLKRSSPSLTHERDLWAQGHEVRRRHGRGRPGLVGRPAHRRRRRRAPDRRVYKIRDSKPLTEPEREALFDRIAGVVRGLGRRPRHRRGVRHAWACPPPRSSPPAGPSTASASAEPDRCLLDGNWDFVGRGTTVKLVKGDARCLSIAAASILAKVTRDRMMRAEADDHPGYDFDLNKGYPCPRHKVGPGGLRATAIHRRSWVFMDELVWGGCKRVVPIGGQLGLFG